MHLHLLTEKNKRNLLFLFEENHLEQMAPFETQYRWKGIFKVLISISSEI